jgi:alpha-beta hydrolase superfamily lysophospholipase
MSVIDHPLLTEKYFFPRPDEPPDEGRFEVTAADGESTLVCWRSAPHDPKKAKTVVHWHGNGEVVADYVPEFAQVLNEFGVNVVLAEYRGYGGSGGLSTISAILDDAEAVFQALGLPEEQVIGFARSLGSFCVLELAERHPRLAGVILDSSIADVVERILMRISPEDVDMTEAELEADVYVRCDHEAKLRSYQGPLLVVHAANDSMVNVSHAERLHAWGGGKDKQLVLLPNGDHDSIMVEDRKAYLAAVGTFLRGLR